MNSITMNPNAVELIPEEALDPRVLAFIRDTPACLSLLYDLGILPEQLDPLSSPVGARDHWRLNAVVASMAGMVERQQAIDAQHANQLAAIANTVFAIETAIDPLSSRVANAKIINDGGASALILISIIKCLVNKAKAILKP